jgi:hypothetical protein
MLMMVGDDKWFQLNALYLLNFDTNKKSHVKKVVKIRISQDS